MWGHVPVNNPFVQLAFTPAEEKLSVQMRAAWVQFAPSGTAPWQPWTTGEAALMIFNTTDGGGSRLDYRWHGAQCDVFDSITLPQAPAPIPGPSGLDGKILALIVIACFFIGVGAIYFYARNRPDSASAGGALADEAAYRAI